MSLAGTDGLRLDQAPPLSIPASFFLLVPLAMIAGGAVLATPGTLAGGWTGPTIALAHLGTLGLLGAGMLGALYQMTPVVAGIPVPAVRLARGVHLAFAGGVAALVGGLLTGGARATGIGAVLLATALVAFLVPLGIALLRAPARGETVWGMRLAVASLATVASLGVRMALGHAGLGFAAPRDLWLQVHLVLGLCGWVGGLIAAVSWQVVPMFYLAPMPKPVLGRAVLGLLLVGLLGPLGVLGAVAAGALDPTGAARLAGLAAAPAMVAVWVVHPLWVTRALRTRRRKLVDGSAGFWWAAMAAAPGVLALAVAARFGEDPRWSLAFGWLAIWGWAGCVLHGMLTRIVPFLVWFHRFSSLVGKRPVPAMRQLWPDVRVRVGLALHVAATLAGLVAIGTRVQLAAVGAGLLVGATGVWLLGNLALTLWRRPGPAAAV